MAKDYISMNANPTDPDKYSVYQPLSMKAIDPYGGKFLVHGERGEAFEGSTRPASVVLEFVGYIR